MPPTAIAAEAEERLPTLFAELDLTLRIGGLTDLRSRHGQVILVRLVVPSAELLVLQLRIATLCGADTGSVRRWSLDPSRHPGSPDAG